VANGLQAGEEREKCEVTLPRPLEIARDQQAAQPVLAPQRFDLLPCVEQQGRAERWWQLVGDGNGSPPFAHPCGLVPFLVIEQAKPVLAGLGFTGGTSAGSRRAKSIQHTARTCQNGIDLRQLRVSLMRRARGPRHRFRARRSWIPVRAPARRQYRSDRHARIADRPVRFASSISPAGAQDRMRDRQFMARCARIHMGVVQHEVLEMDKFACHPHGADRIEEMTALGKAFGDRGAQRALIEPRQASSARTKCGNSAFRTEVSISWDIAMFPTH
jgi:hypothetical protein